MTNLSDNTYSLRGLPISRPNREGRTLAPGFSDRGRCHVVCQLPRGNALSYIRHGGCPLLYWGNPPGKCF